MKMKKLRIDALFFLLLIALLGLANSLNTDKPAVSVLEHRTLEKKPEFSLPALFSGSYFRGLENYYSDTFVLRDSLVKASRGVQQALSVLGPGITIITAPEKLPLSPDPEGETPPDEPGEIEAPPEINPLLPEINDHDQDVGYWIVVDGQALQLFKFNRESFDFYAGILNSYREKLNRDVKIYSMIAPTNSEFVQLKRYQGITDSQNQALGYLESKLDPGIEMINVYDALKGHINEYIYFRTDHHWTALGAYYGYRSFMKTKGEAPVPLEKYRRVDLEGFLGSSYSKTLDKSLEENPDTLSVYLPFTEHDYTIYYGRGPEKREVIDMQYADSKTNKYLVFISGGELTWGEIKTNVNNRKKILVVKDSFGNALVPFLLPHYEEIYIVDSRFFSIGAAGKNIIQFIEDNGINEVLFMHYMEDVNWHKFMEGVQALMG